MTTVVCFLSHRLHLLDLAGPAQVFSTAADLGHDYRLRYVGETTTVETAQGVGVHAETTWPRIEPGDLVLVPGWRSPVGHHAHHVGAETADRLRAHHDAGGMVASVCSGAFALARAGLLTGRSCTTHHALQDDLARSYPKARVKRDVLYVVDGSVATSAGIASGIDLALHLTAVAHGPAVAAAIAREMVVFARRNGDESQASAMFRHRAHLSDVVHRVQDRIDASFADRLNLDRLAADAGVSPRTLTRLFRTATGLTPLRYQQALRLERAEHLIGRGSTVETAARRVGFADARMLRRLRARATDSG